MGAFRGYFKSMFAALKVRKDYGNGSSLEISFERLGHSLDVAQKALDDRVWSDIKKYMPSASGTLIEQTEALNANAWGEVYFLPPNNPYGHYQYEGIMYEDPLYHVGAFYSPDYGFWSRPGVSRVPSERELEYSKSGVEAHWDEVAYANHKNEWIETARTAVRNS